MWRRRDQHHARRRMAQVGDEFGDLEARKLAALAGLGALCDLDFYLVAGAQIFGGDAETAARDLLDVAVGIVAVRIGAIARAVLAAFARPRLGANAVHRDGQRLVRLGRQRAQSSEEHTSEPQSLMRTSYAV